MTRNVSSILVHEPVLVITATSLSDVSAGQIRERLVLALPGNHENQGFHSPAFWRKFGEIQQATEAYYTAAWQPQ